MDKNFEIVIKQRDSDGGNSFASLDFTNELPIWEIKNKLERIFSPERPKVVCVCGSTRFIQEIAVLQWEFEKQGYFVLGMHLLPGWYMPVSDHGAEHQGVKAQHDALHLKKIDSADIVFVYNKDEYIGESTSNEIQDAKNKGKIIQFLITPEGEKNVNILRIPDIIKPLPNEEDEDKQFKSLFVEATVEHLLDEFKEKYPFVEDFYYDWHMGWWTYVIGGIEYDDNDSFDDMMVAIERIREKQIQ